VIYGQLNPKKKNFMFQVESIQRYYFDWSTAETFYGVGFLEYEDVDEDVNYSPREF
jgi:hypothetical protein